MRRAWIVCALLFASAQINATTLRPVTAIELIDRAELIFTGIAVDRQVALTRDGSHPYTFVTFTVDSVIKGAVEGETLTLRLEGGEIGENYLEVIGIPEFQREREYLLFVADNGEAISPIVGWTQGQFELVEHPSRMDEKVLIDRNGQAVEGLSDGSFLRSRVERDEWGLKRAQSAPPGIKVVSEEGVTITDPLLPDLAKADFELVPASVVLRSVGKKVRDRVQAEGFRQGTVVPSLTIDDVPETFSLRWTGAANR